MDDRRFVASIYSNLLKCYGQRGWWPAETSFEVFVGAILTQQTSWGNVEKAISNLKNSGALSMDSIADATPARISRLIKPSGYYRQKAARLVGACRRIKHDYGSLEGLFALGTKDLREALLSLNGIGKETADSILLYGAGRPVFVVDAYTTRIMCRLSNRFKGMNYDLLQEYFMLNTRKSARLYNDFHAQLVELGKRHCRAKPVCPGCPLARMCEYARSRAQ